MLFLVSNFLAQVRLILAVVRTILARVSNYLAQVCYIVAAVSTFMALVSLKLAHNFYRHPLAFGEKLQSPDPAVIKNIE